MSKVHEEYNLSEKLDIDLDCASRPWFSLPHFHWATMMVDLTIVVIPILWKLHPSNLIYENSPESVHVCVDENLNERKEKVEDEPDVNHLDVGRLWQVVGHIDEHGG